MKRKLLILLCACMLLGGCGEGNTGNSGALSGSETQVGNTSESGNVAGNASESGNEAGNASESGNEVGSGEPVTSEPGGGELKKLGAGSGRVITPVELRNAGEKAAFLADQVYEENGGNVLVSPLSLNLALGMVAEGTTGETATELYRYLGREDYAEWADRYFSFAEGLKAEKTRDSEYSFSYQLADSIWVRQDARLKESYKELVTKKFRAEAENVDFMGKPAETAGKINSWCDKHTNGLVKEVVKPDAFTEDLKAVLVNSVYFESPWIGEWGLREHKFTDLEGKTSEQEMLFDVVTDYYENDACTAFAKRYYNGFCFIGILPKQEGEFQLKDLDLQGLLESKTAQYDVRALMPKLDFDTTTDCLVDVLRAQGVLRIFDPNQAEFGEMIEDSMLFVSDVLQKCKIELDEKGTRAAAVTVIMAEDAAAMEPEPREVKEVFLDRPFAFLIYDQTNDQIVFAGKVTDLQ